MKRILLTAALVLTAGLAFAQDLNDPRLALNTVPDSAHFYYYINMYPQIGQWDIKKARAKEFGYHSEYVLEGKFDRIWTEVTNTALSDFEAKLYYNVGIDDKFGFEPETDWTSVIEVLSLYKTN